MQPQGRLPVCFGQTAFDDLILFAALELLRRPKRSPALSRPARRSVVRGFCPSKQTVGLGILAPQAVFWKTAVLCGASFATSEQSAHV